MKIKMSAFCLLSLMLVSCSEYRPTTSHYGHGVYHCYYHDAHSGHFYRADADEKSDATQAAKNTCLGKLPKDLNHRYCEFAACIFK